MTERIHVTVTVDTDELREWADRHADMGHHGVAHVLYKAANDCESLTEQAIREAEKRGAIEAWRTAADMAATCEMGAHAAACLRLTADAIDRADSLGADA